MNRIEPLKKADLPQHEGIFELVEGMMGFLPNSMLIMARKPGLLEAFAGLGAVIRGESSLQPGLADMITYLVSRSSGCQYCQAHTSHTSVRAGVTEEKMAQIWSYETSDLFSEAERAALRVAQSAGQVPNAVTDDDFAELRKFYSDDQILEIVALVSFMGFLNRWNDTLATALEAAPLDYAQAHLAGDGWSAGKHG